MSFYTSLSLLLVTLSGTKFLIETHETPVYQIIVFTILMDKADISRRNGDIAQPSHQSFKTPAPLKSLATLGFM